MSYEDMLTDRCDIYHMQLSAGPGRFGVPAAPELKYGSVPDAIDVSCWFVEKGQSINQAEPNNEILHSFLVHFLPDTDVRVNDKVVWNGVELTLQVPRDLRGHHWEVTATRRANL
ncbi:DUF3599 family protein [Paenibacillus sp. ClWae2A]|uniref:DUF3599 family protein n=1 Tax=Paenibacillus sp. ClWae2A TaxID=3057177 RepID=UPI0028F66C11|nr:DUF3599 family protein [Paenibacillus sp. ClWae2A]MDT9719131.1 DUF3599 family protein [Paenibacillus sp. ClWae2A]